MKRIFVPVLTASALMFTACASKPKVEDPAPPAAIAAPAPTPAAAAGVPAVTKDGTSIVACEKGADHRSLDLRSKGKGCELAYVKSGQSAVVASAKHGFDRCEAAMKKIQDKLTAGGYVCR